MPNVSPLGPVEAVLINTAGGLTDGDRLEFEGAVSDGARVTFTTQACERLYASRGGFARISTSLKIGDGATLAWVPQETILFDTACLRRDLNIEMAPDSTLLAHESLIFGRTAMGERLSSGALNDHWTIRRGGQYLHAEALRVAGDISERLKRSALLATATAMTTIIYVAPDAEEAAAPLRELVESLAGGNNLVGVTAWNGKLILRGLAVDGFHLRRIVIPVLSTLSHGAPLPRVWSI